MRCRLAGATLTALPFECPFDHVLESSRWDGAAGLPYRTIGFQPHPRATRARVRLGGPAPPAAGEREGWDAVIAAPPAGGYSDAALRAALAPHAGAEVLELGGAVAPVACLRRDLAVEGWYTWAATAPGLLAVLTSLLDVRIAYCCELNWLARRALPTVGGMVAKHCGAAEEKVGSSNPRSPDFGRVRRRQDCPCEWGFQLPPPLPLVAGDACDAAGG